MSKRYNQALPAKKQRDFVPLTKQRDTEKRANNAQQADGMSVSTLSMAGRGFKFLLLTFQYHVGWG
jgi:hypothetical protein